MVTKTKAKGALRTLKEFLKKASLARKNHPTSRKPKRRKGRKKHAAHSWFGHKAAHRKAALKGWRKRKTRRHHGKKKHTHRHHRGTRRGK